MPGAPSSFLFLASFIVLSSSFSAFCLDDALRKATRNGGLPHTSFAHVDWIILGPGTRVEQKKDWLEVAENDKK